MYYNRRPQVSVVPTLPPGAQQPAVPSPTPTRINPGYAFPSPAYSFELSPPPFVNPWEPQAYEDRPLPPLPPPLNVQTPPTPTPSRPRVQSMVEHYPRPSASTHGSGSSQRTPPFPEPQVFRATSHRANLTPPQKLTHHYSRSDLTGQPPIQNALRMHNPSVVSFASSYNQHAEDDQYGSGSNEAFEDDANDLVRDLADLSINSEEALRRFQAGELKEKDQEWHLLVPVGARDALGKKEVQRQSVIFEVVKSEREYVADLEAVQHVFIDRLRSASPPIIPEHQLKAFITEVFGNLHEIVGYHQRILAALFARQREQHPLIQSVADIFLDTTLQSDFRSAYETYIKHYPLSESHHRKQLKRNRAYEGFIQSVSNDPRIRKRDLITFLSRPVTRLPRLNLLLEQILKLTDTEYEHPDLETLPIILGILKDCIKSTQPGIEAAESKVKFWGLCESLIYQKGEIIDMDLYDESRSLAYTGPVLRKAKSDTGFSEKWLDLVAALLDNFLILTREEKRPNGSIKRLLMSRPIPLSFLRLGAFDSPPETRREKADDGRLLESLRYQTVPIYPFTVYHASSRSTRRYTLYVPSEALRKRWYNALVDAIGLHKVRQDANMWFNPQNLTDGFFRVSGREGMHTPASKFTGKINCAVPFVNGGKRFLAVGCPPGIYVAPVNSEKFKWILNYKNATSLAALTTLGTKSFNRLLVHADSAIVSYSLDILARLALGQSHPQTLEASIERIGGNDNNIIFCRHVHLSGRALLIYASKRRLSSSMTLHVLEAVDSSELVLTPKRSVASNMRSFRPFGDPGYVPKDAYDVIALAKTIGICTNDGIVTADPTNLANSTVAVVPNLLDATTNAPMSSLKARLEGCKPLGFLRVDPNELLVVYNEIGCYINKQGVPTRKSGYIKWETTAVSYAHRNGHIMLISPEFIEIRSITTGRIVQVIEGRDIRLLYSGPYMSKDDPVLVAMRGGKNDKDGVSEKIVELTETEEITVRTPGSATVSSIWDEWDM
ncbi:hypothetical protein B0H34DRAFT_731762 [Crassisporium funariophilum]|nr:hypothetical protein B0H34DRAFT_731762 [Crassisporium funariophilum]